LSEPLMAMYLRWITASSTMLLLSTGARPIIYLIVLQSLSKANGLILPVVLDAIDSLALTGSDRRIFDVGCGNGSVAYALSAKGYEVVGVDPSKQACEHWKRAYPNLKLSLGSAYDDLRTRFGQFPVVISLEVIEHLYSPWKFASTVHDLLYDGGTAIISTPFHGYFKNLALAVTGKWDTHFNVLSQCGHIKFWSVKTLSRLLIEAGFRSIHLRRVGRIPPLAKSMIAAAGK